MFSGIIKKTGIIKHIVTLNNGKRIGIKSKLSLKRRDIGSSISCSGICLTLEKIHKDLIFFFLSKETLKKSNFRYVKLNQVVNLEMPLKFGHYISGHFVQGHVDTTSKLKKKKFFGKSLYLYFSIDRKLKKFLISKGSVSINGVSLTITNVYKRTFLIVVIPYTLKLTNLINIKTDDIVNVEIDIFAKYIKSVYK